MPLTLPRRVTFVAKAEYFTSPGIKGWFQKKFFSGAGQVPIDRSGATAAEGALKAAKRILGEGGLFGIYPEGTRSHDGRLYRGKTGVARLALETKVPVIPIAVVGTDVVAPPGKKFGAVTRPDRALRQAAGLLAATRAWRTTASSCARSPTRSCTRSCGSPARSTSTCTPPAPRPSTRSRGSPAPVRGRRPTSPDRPGDDRAQSLLRMARRAPATGLLDPVSEQVETTLFRALAVLRFVVAAYAVALNAARWREFEHPRRRLAGGRRDRGLDRLRHLGVRRPAPSRPAAARRRLRGRRGDPAVHALRAERGDARAARLDDAVVLGDGGRARLGGAPGLDRRPGAPRC